MKRYGWVIGIKPDKLEEYKRLHANVWPGVLGMIKRCHIQNYSIYLRQLDDGNYYLFSYLEYAGPILTATWPGWRPTPRRSAGGPFASRASVCWPTAGKANGGPTWRKCSTWISADDRPTPRARNGWWSRRCHTARPTGRTQTARPAARRRRPPCANRGGGAFSSRKPARSVSASSTNRPTKSKVPCTPARSGYPEIRRDAARLSRPVRWSGPVPRDQLTAGTSLAEIGSNHVRCC